MSVPAEVDPGPVRAAAPALLGVAAVLLELTVFTAWRPFDLVPDPLLVVVIYLSFFAGPEWGPVVGLLGGYVIDSSVGEFVGLTALSKMCVGLLFGWLARIVFPNHLGVLVSSVPVATVLDQLIYVLALKAFGYPMPPVTVLLAAVSKLALANLVIGFPFYLYAFRRWRKGRGGGGWRGSPTTTVG